MHFVQRTRNNKHGCFLYEEESPWNNVNVPPMTVRLKHICHFSRKGMIKTRPVFMTCVRQSTRHSKKESLCLGTCLSGRVKIIKGIEPIVERVSAVCDPTTPPRASYNPCRKWRPTSSFLYVWATASIMYPLAAGIALIPWQRHIQIWRNLCWNVRISKRKIICCL
jgi:hypothetical protein